MAPAPPPTAVKDALQKFEDASKLSTGPLTTAYFELERISKEHNIKIKNHLSSDSIRSFALTSAIFSRTRFPLAKLAESSWALDGPAILDLFGPHSLLSLDFVDQLRRFALLGQDIPWSQAKVALDKARERRLTANVRGVTKRDWCTTDVVAAMGALGIVDKELNTRGSRARRKKQKLSNPVTLTPTDDDDSNNGTKRTLADPDQGQGAPNQSNSGACSVNHSGDKHDGHGESGKGDDGEGALSTKNVSDDSDQSQFGADTNDSDDESDVERVRRLGSPLGNSTFAMAFGTDVEDYSFQQEMGIGADEDAASYPRDHFKPTDTPLKRQLVHKPDTAEPPFKYRRICRDRSVPRSSLLVEDDTLGSDVISSPSAPEERLDQAMSSGHILLRRSRCKSLPPTKTKTHKEVKATAIREVQKTRAKLSKYKSTSIHNGPSFASPSYITRNCEKGGAAAAIKESWSPPHAADVLQQLRPLKWIGHKTIWTMVELFLPPSQGRIIDVPVPSADQTWEMWASDSRNHIRRLEDDSLLLVPLYLAERKHWVLLSFDLELRKASLFDSISDDATTKKLAAAARAITTALGLSWDKGRWRYDSNQKAPQQTNGDDCGIHVIVVCIHLIARTDLPDEINGLFWRVALSRTLDAQPSGSFLPSLATDVPSDEPIRRDPKALVETAQAHGERALILTKSAKYAHEMVSVVQMVHERLSTSKVDDLERLRRDVSVRKMMMENMDKLSQSLAADVEYRNQLEETLTQAQEQLEMKEMVAKCLEARVTVLGSLKSWLEKQRIEIRARRDRADQDEAEAMSAIYEGHELLQRFLGQKGTHER
ncbi:hypothetical protein JOL62DRAFT_588729 [Phyllosticta paracitricarpa]|uniref:Ubiquitin-like protease family profile domain-containing protein n=1 Tax=Phyllosticta paracitricarpa TaxID=2016321 RepID=A0ABR1MVS5_9PEZI